MSDRNIGEVVDQMLEKIPASAAGLRADLRCMMRDASYLAPELMGGLWDVLSVHLNHHVPFPPEEDWQWEVGAIMADKSVNEFKAMAESSYA